MSDTPLQPKRQDSVAVIVKIGRISTPEQDRNNIQASFKYLDPHIQRIWSGKTEMFEYGDQGSGLSLERTEMQAAEVKIGSGIVDAVFIEDISRAYREPSNILSFLYRCNNNDTRVLCPGDGIDTADENWFTMALTACLRHGMHIPDTIRRVRRTADFAFGNGGMVTRLRFCYRRISKEDAASGKYGTKNLRIRKDPDAEPIIHELCRMVIEDRRPPAYLARWMNQKSISTSQYSTQKRWTAAMIRDLLADPILYGLRRFRDYSYKYDMQSGKHFRKKNPHPLEKHWPELAFITETQFHEMNAALDENCGLHRGKIRNKQASRKAVPRCNAIYPRQHLECAICSRNYVETGYDWMKCYFALPRNGKRCWNRVQVHPQKIIEISVDLLIAELDRVDGARETVYEEIQKHLKQLRSIRWGDREVCQHRIATLKKRIKQTIAMHDAVSGEGDEEDYIDVEFVSKIESLRKELRTETEKQQQFDNLIEENDLPVDMESVKNNFRTILIRLAGTTFEFADFMRKIITCLKIVPIQSIDSGQVHPRLLMTINIGSLIGKPCDLCSREFNCFEEAVHFQCRKAVISKRDELMAANRKATLDVIASELRINRMAVKRALALHKKMLSLGLTEPYVLLTSKPTHASRWRNMMDLAAA